MRRFLLGSPVLTAFLVLFQACGAAAPGAGRDVEGPRSVKTDQDRDPQTIEEAKQQLDRAVAQMDQHGGQQIDQPQNYTGGGGGGGVGPTVAPTPHPPPTAQETECARMCRAFASMQRAQTALCRMAGDEDTRCAEAKKVVEDNAKRVAHCGCH